MCNACGLYYKLHGSSRPISMKSDVIRKRARHDARRVGNGPSETPSASPGASRRASPVAEATPTLAPDSSTTSTSIYNGENLEYRPSMQSELMGALGDGNGSFGSSNNYFSYSSFPGPYNPDYLAQSQNLTWLALPSRHSARPVPRRCTQCMSTRVGCARCDPEAHSAE